MVTNAIENFSDSYMEKIKESGKENYSIEDIRTAFKEGAIWMKNFLDVKTMLLNNNLI